MEKYKHFTDESTGINPFTPYHGEKESSQIQQQLNNQQQSFFYQLFYYLHLILLPILIPLKIILFILFLFPYFVFSMITKILPLPNIVKKFVMRYVSVICMKFILFLFFGIFNHSQHLKEFNFNLEGNAINSKNLQKLNDGDLIICNFVSYLEIFYLVFKYSPIFTILQKTNENKIIVKSTNLFGILYHICFGQFSLQNNLQNSENLSEIIKFSKNNKLGPIIVFPEGVTSNNRSILKFQNEIFLNIEQTLQQEKINIHFIGFKYLIKNRMNPALYLNEFFKHFFKILISFELNLNIYHFYLNENDLEILKRNFVTNLIRSVVMPKVMGVVAVERGMGDRELFLKEYEGNK
ncbi:hypothetical protein ABK040_004624 [Willaertia magna]